MSKYDARKTSGIKLHIGIDVLGPPHTLMVTTANMTDWCGATDMTAHYCDVTDHSSKLQKVLADGGYSGEKFANEIKEISGAEVEVVKRNELHTFALLPKRWIVERSFGWLDKCYRLWKNRERKLHTSLHMVFRLSLLERIVFLFSLFFRFTQLELLEYAGVICYSDCKGWTFRPELQTKKGI